VAAGAEAVDRADSGHDQAASPGGESREPFAGLDVTGERYPPEMQRLVDR
jgi:hypothetical protein